MIVIPQSIYLTIPVHTTLLRKYWTVKVNKKEKVEQFIQKLPNKKYCFIKSKEIE